MSQWYRVFGLSEVPPTLAALQERFDSDAVESQIQSDEQGWYRAAFAWENGGVTIDRYLVSEEGIRRELNTWAAWVESTGEGELQSRLMQRLIATQQLLVMRDLPDGIADELCRSLAVVTDGVYQIDGEGFFGADGSLLLRDDEEDETGG
jgi:hypothetical protein